MSVRTGINAKHDHTVTEKKRNPLPYTLLTHSCPSFPKRVSVSLYSLLFPTDYPSISRFYELPTPPPTPSTFSSCPISSAIIPLFHFSWAQLIGHVCTVTWGPDIIAGQIARRLASDLSQLSCAQTPADWKA